ncbi:MAG: tRNA pseudouridine(55) synthase TruB [Balneolales bacterium]|nr:tRNA pseudouridine(55) synthase TruB [Balneolales bacterium]
MAHIPPLDSFPVFSSENLPSPEFDFSSGSILLLNKPPGWTSFDVVKYVRGRLKTKKVGHAGTLDPMATGLLVICSGKATKAISQIQDQSKTYIAEITFGGSTPSYDAESEIDQSAPFEHISSSGIKNMLGEQFSGEIQQVPPMYSALKRDGKKLYELARRGKSVELEPRPVTIYEHEILDFSCPKVILRITCSKGTYIRSIAHDLGLALHSRAYLSALERINIGVFSNKIALTPHQINDLLNRNG